jgi:tetraacyldisaccharide 4'-kinase
MSFDFHSKVQSIWYGKSPIRFVLWPFSMIFGGILIFRKLLYFLGIKKIATFDCPVIVVGNITVGGTGKTPLVIALAAFLQSRGYSPGIVSRGYKGTCKSPELVRADSDPNCVGDEAVLLARRTNCPLVVCADRVLATAWLLKNCPCDIVLSDDGLQHFALGRNFEILVIDGERGFGNGFLIPAGPLREPKNRLKTIQCCVINGGEDQNPALYVPHPFIMRLEPGAFVNLKTGQLLNHHLLNSAASEFVCGVKKLHAVAGIGNPGRFFRMLKSLGLTFNEHSFPDHYYFQPTDFDFLEEHEWVLMTEKDAVKCTAFADERYWYVPVTGRLSEAFFRSLPESLFKISTMLAKNR